MKYLIYLRVSTDDQDNETQLDHCIRFINQIDQSDFKYEIFKDKMTSKKTLDKRPGGMELLASMNHKDVVVALRLDRIARSLSEATLLIDLLEKKGAEILLVTQPGIKNKIMLGVYAGMAEEEVKLLRKRVTEKLDTKRRKGERYSGKIPYGYGMHKTHMVPIRVGKDIIYKPGVLIAVEEEQKAIEMMYNFHEVGMSYHAIAKELDRLGIKNREGNPFQKMSIYRILERLKQAKLKDQPHVLEGCLVSR